VSYVIRILPRAGRELNRLTPQVFGEVAISIAGLGEDPRPHGSRKLVGRDGWRIRVGRYRVIYEIDDAQRFVTILHVGHRKDIYR
jgi:mRNA interferase RelE/StbE